MSVSNGWTSIDTSTPDSPKARLPHLYELRLRLADGTPRAFRTTAYTKLDAEGQLRAEARQVLGDDAFRAAVVWGTERVQ
jgi:hypothetical protein